MFEVVKFGEGSAGVHKDIYTQKHKRKRSRKQCDATPSGNSPTKETKPSTWEYCRNLGLGGIVLASAMQLVLGEFLCFCRIEGRVGAVQIVRS